MTVELPRDWPLREHSRFVMKDGIRWHVQIAGTGPAMLLLHGTGASTHSFRALLPLLAASHTVIAPDLPGHAFTVLPPDFAPSLPAMAAALARLLGELGKKPEVVVGHSAGAAILARMVLDGRIAPALLVGLGAALVPFRRPAFAPLARALATTTLAARALSFGAAGADRLIRSTGSRLDGRGVALYRRLIARPEHVAGVLAMLARWDLDALYQALPSLATPVLLLAGDGDRAVPLAQERALVERLPNARLEIVRGGHLFHEERPVQVAELILDAACGTAGAPSPTR